MNTHITTKNFRKRFHMLNIPAKLEVIHKIRTYHDTGVFPSGYKMTEDQRKNLFELLTWCDRNTFFDDTPSKFDEPKY